MVSKSIKLPAQRLVAFCRRNHIRRLVFFGSVLQDDFRPESDVDVLVAFDPSHIPGFALIRMQDELSPLLRRHGDLVTARFLDACVRETVVSEAQVKYATGNRYA